jgi:hypothetical protein
MLWHFTILKMCVYEEYHLVFIFKDYLVSMWYIILMTNSNSIMSINHLVGFYLPLVAKVQISRFGDSVGSTPETPMVQPRRLWPPSEFPGPIEIDFNNLFENLFITLWGSIMLCAYYKTMKICIFEVVSHSVDIVNYLAYMWHVFSNKFQFAKLFYCSCSGSCL